MNHKNHEYADLFPMMTPLELEALAADVKEHGLRHPITRYQGKILDGRNRLKACEIAGLEPTFADYEGDDEGALSLVESFNTQRRDLTGAQRAVVAARRWGLTEHGKGGRPSKEKPVSLKPVSLADVTRRYKVSKRDVSYARDLIMEAPDLVVQVEACALSLAAAYEQLQQRQNDEKLRQQEAERKARDAERIAYFNDAVSNGDMTLPEAIEVSRGEAREEEDRQRYDAEARGLWDGQIQKALAILRESVSNRTDEHLAWYTEPGATGSNIKTTPAQIEEAIALLSRVLSSTFHVEE